MELPELDPPVTLRVVTVKSPSRVRVAPYDHPAPRSSLYMGLFMFIFPVEFVILTVRFPGVKSALVRTTLPYATMRALPVHVNVPSVTVTLVHQPNVPLFIVTIAPAGIVKLPPANCVLVKDPSPIMIVVPEPRTGLLPPQTARVLPLRSSVPDVMMRFSLS